MINRISSQFSRINIVAPDYCFSVQPIPSSVNKDCNQVCSVLAAANALYSLSAVDLVITDCFFEDYDIRLFPK